MRENFQVLMLTFLQLKNPQIMFIQQITVIQLQVKMFDCIASCLTELIFVIYDEENEAGEKFHFTDFNNFIFKIYRRIVEFFNFV